MHSSTAVVMYVAHTNVESSTDNESVIHNDIGTEYHHFPKVSESSDHVVTASTSLRVCYKGFHGQALEL